MELTKFDFEHRVFTMPGSYIFRSEPDSRVMLHVALGDIQGAMTAESVQREFGIDPASKDGQLLDLADEALNYIKFITPGESIPSEILDGSASWPIEEEHYERARNKLMRQVAAWVSQEEVDLVDYSAIAKDMESPEVQERIQDGFKQAAEALSLTNKEQVVELIEQLGRELAYIEALRSYFEWIFRLPKEIKSAQSTLRGDKQTLENAIRAHQLVLSPVRRYKSSFQNVDGQVTEIISALRNVERVVEFVRSTRDELHLHTLRWSEIQSVYQDADMMNRKDAREVTNQLYSFLAKNFLENSGW